MSERVKDSELIDEDPPFHSSTSPGDPIPSDLRVAGFDKRRVVETLDGNSQGAAAENVVNDSDHYTTHQGTPETKE